MTSPNILVKVNANYTCSRCGSTENVQAHHQVPGDDSTLVVLCGECHSLEHPEVPKGLITCIKSHQPYWVNKSASTLAKELGVHSRTVIRASRKLGIGKGIICRDDIMKLGLSVRSGLKLNKYSREDGRCPECGSLNTKKNGRYPVQNWQCNECGRQFRYPRIGGKK
jgi:hypothetical protein